MRRWIDLAILLLLVGTPVLILLRLPDGLPIFGKPRELEIPRPRASAVGSTAALPAPLPVPSPVGVREADSGSDATPQARVAPGLVELIGLSFRGAEQPLAGPLPITISGEGAPEADEGGRFRLDGIRGPISWVATPGSPSLTLPETGGSGVLAVHQYPRSPEDSLIEPVAAMLLQIEARSPRLLVAGRAELPDGAEIAVRILAAGYALESALLRVREERFAGEIELSPREYHAGVYTLQFAWGRNLATRDLYDAYLGQGGSPFDGELRREVGVYFGTTEQARHEESEIREFYRAALEDLEGSRDILLVCGAKARGKRSKLLDDPARVARLRGHSLAPAVDAIFRGKKLELDEWRRLIDTQVPERIARYTPVEKVPFPLKHPQAAHNLAQMADQLRKYAKLESTVVYAALGLEQDRRDFEPSNDFSTPEIEREQTLLRLENFSAAVRTAIGL